MSRRHEGNTLTDEDRNDMDVEFIDLTSVKERGDQAGAAHHPDLLAWSCPQILRERFHRLRHKLDAWRSSSGRLSREHKVCEFRIEKAPGLASLLVVIQKPVVRLAP